MIPYVDLLGTPYLRGSMDPRRGVDCCGVVLLLLKRWGLRIPDVSGDLDAVLEAWSKTDDWECVLIDDLRDGDVVQTEGTHGHAAGVSIVVNAKRRVLVSSFEGKGVRALPLRWTEGRLVGAYRWRGERGT